MRVAGSADSGGVKKLLALRPSIRARPHIQLEWKPQQFRFPVDARQPASG